MNIQKAFLLQTAAGPTIILTRNGSFKEPGLISALARNGRQKFEAHELPLSAVADAYREHYGHLSTDPKESDELIVLDNDGERVYNNIRFQDFGASIYYDHGISR